ncbi:AcrR family transcriptional regulator [Okibacterium sp. HSC-33S16]|uniref:TetR/AcrR family transcriptional regulator n=1 Tax=Okibacterium sp. HSC-33S16 TaxID=2910965 RepID=UPI0020A13562|nr:WHG domain-containing protein [Okibacterium sp. HSC-33S16]MCP2032696.1 AcrR family transcriptional regulator [Okibacterium sp. HSC-33S16]
MSDRPYHHGDLRKAVIDAAVDVISDAGPAAVSLRDLARRIGVSHAAPAHHFGDKEGLFTAVATEGYTLLADELGQVEPASDFVELSVAYVRFAVDHEAHFEVMFRPDLFHNDDPALVTARNRSRSALFRGVASLPPERRGGDTILTNVSAWAFVHGFATLWLQGALPKEMGATVDDAVRVSASFLFGRVGH